MNLDSLNKWLMLAANIGVIAGIIFLAVEVQQNNSLMEAEARYRMFENRVSNLRLEKQSPECAALVLKIYNREPLSEIDRLRVESRTMEAIFSWQWEYGEYQAGRLSRQELPVDGWRRAFDINKSFVDVWPRAKQNLSRYPEFLEFIESEVINKN